MFERRIPGEFPGPSQVLKTVTVEVPENFGDCLRVIADFLDLGDQAIYALTDYLPGSSVQEDLDKWAVLFDKAIAYSSTTTSVAVRSTNG